MSNETNQPTTILCVSSFFKGNDFLEQCKIEGCHVILLTVESILSKPWVRSHIDEVFALPNFQDKRAVINAVAYLMRTRNISRIAPLDDYDVELVAHLREHTRLPGMGETTGRYFRDKLAMRTRARDRGIRVPDFSGIFNYDDLRHFFTHVQGPWLIKPRWEASSVGIRKLHTPNDIWPILDELGDRQSDYLVEKMIPGDVFHVDSLVSEKQVVFAEVHQYRKPLLEVMQGGGIFATCTVDRTSETEQALLSVHDTVVKHFGMLRGVTHTEYIRGREDNQVYFLETAARVGGVHIADLVEASTGVNLWREWAKIEISQGTTPYHVEARRREYSGLIVSLTRQEFPDSSQFTDSEIVWRMNDNPYHIGLVVRSPSRARVLELLSDYETRFYRDYWASMPAARAATA